MSRELRSSARRNIENRENNVAIANTSSPDTNVKILLKTSIRFTETITITTRQQHSVTCVQDKENRVLKNEIEHSVNVKQLKSHFEGISNSQKNVIVNGAQSATATGAIKKQQKPNSGIEFSEEKNIVPRKRAKIREDNGFTKSRFKVYTDVPEKSNDKKREIEKSDRKSKNSLATKRDVFARYPSIALQTLNKNASPAIKDTFQVRVTPVEVPAVPPTLPKQVKALHRKRTMIESQKSDRPTYCLSHNSDYKLPYDDFFIQHELEKEKSVSNISRNLRQRNITTEQRKIIVKFLTRLHTHLFLPSFFLYQTVELFDAVLDAKMVDVKDLQLIALAAMWIALKREHSAYNVPTADKMISFADDLYEGKTSLLLKCEMDILQTLNFNIVFPDPFSTLCYNIMKCNRSQFMTSHQIKLAYACGSYMIDVSLFDENLLNTSAILLAAAAAETALYFTMEAEDYTIEPLWSKWRAPDMDQRYSDEEIDRVRSMLITKIFESTKRHSDAEIVFKKYQRSRYGKISHFLGNKVEIYLHGE